MLFSSFLGFCFLAFLAYLFRHKKVPKLAGRYSQSVGDTWSTVKFVLSVIALGVLNAIRRYHRRKNFQSEEKANSLAVPLHRENVNSLTLSGNDKNGYVVVVRFRRHDLGVAETSLTIRLHDGRVLTMPESPNMVHVDETNEENCDKKIDAGALRIRCIKPVLEYRVLFNGMMKLNNGDEEGDKEIQYVQVALRLWFRSLHDPTEASVDFSPVQLAHCVSAENSAFKCLSAYFNNNSPQYENGGEFSGYIEISRNVTTNRDEEENERLELTLNGLRQWSTGKCPLVQSEGFFILNARFDSGLIIALKASSQPKQLGITHLISGFIYHMNGYVYPVAWTDLHLANFQFQDEIPNKMIINFEARKF